MAHIPMGDVETMWRQAGHSWSALAQWMKANEGQKNGISSDLMQHFIPVTEQWAKSGKPFPSNHQELYDELNRQLQGAAS